MMPAAAAGTPLGVASEAIGAFAKNGVTGRLPAACPAPILAMKFPWLAGPRQHVPLHAQLAAGLARGLDEAHLEHHLLRLRDLDRIDDLRAELARHGEGLVEHDAVRHGAGQKNAAVDRRHVQPVVREAAGQLGAQRRCVVRHLDVEHADQLLVLAVDRHPGGSELLAEDRQRMVGQRIDVGDVGIAHHDVDERHVGANVIRLADRNDDRGGALGGADHDHALRRRAADEARQGGRERERRHQRDEQRAPVEAEAGASGPFRDPVHMPGARHRGVLVFLVLHIGLPA